MGHLPEIRPHGPNWNESPAGGGIRIHFSVWGSCRRPGSRTRVTGFPALRSYRFFVGTSSKWVHVTAPLLRHFPPEAPPQTLARGNSVPALFPSVASRHACAIAESRGRRMLLPLRGVAPPCWLCEDVRFEKNCAPMVGDYLREAAYAVACRRFERGAEISSSGTRGARATRREVISP
jgi:hypothetical protein